MQRKGPLPGKICALCIPERRFAGLFGYTARISCQSQLVLDAWRVNLAREGRFSRPGPLRGCMERKNCHGLPPGNAPRRSLATDCRPRTHRGEILPLPGIRERIASPYCRGACRSAGCHWCGAAGCRAALARGRRRQTRTVCRVQGGDWYARPAGARGGIGHFAFSGFNCQEQLRVCAVSVGNHEPTSRSAKLCRIMG